MQCSTWNIIIRFMFLCLAFRASANALYSPYLQKCVYRKKFSVILYDKIVFRSFSLTKLYAWNWRDTFVSTFSCMRN